MKVRMRTLGVLTAGLAAAPFIVAAVASSPAGAASSADFTPGLPHLLMVGAPPTPFDGTVTNPADGPDYTNVRYDFAISGISTLTPADLTLQYDNGGTWTDIPLTAGSGGTMTGEFGPHTGFALPHGATNTTHFRVGAKTGSPTGTLTVDNKLDNVNATTGAVSSTIAEHSSSVGVANAYQPVTPTRLVDTRVTGNALNNGPLVANAVYTLDLSKTTAQLDATAYVFNVTAVHPSGLGNLEIGPACGGGIPGTSLINYETGKDIANDVVIPNLVGGHPCNKFIVYSDGSSTNAIFDLQGFYSTTDEFSGVNPSRLVDTRIGQGGTTGPITGGHSASFQVTGAPEGAKAVAINVTASSPTGPGNLEVYPDGVTRPQASNINYIRGVTKAAFDIVQLPANGKIDVYSDGSDANVIIDVFGFLPSTSSTVTQTPARVLDTRSASSSPIQPGAPRNVQIGGAAVGGVPANATAAIISLTAVHAPGSAGIGNLRAYPTGATQPLVSNVNYIPGHPTADIANLAIVPLGTGGSITLATDGSVINAIVDVLGYVPAPPAAAS